MVSRSSDKTESVRVTAAESDAARAAADAARWTIGDLLRAAIVAAGTKPRETFAFLAPFRREQKKAGRPRKAAPPPAG
ncbi:hypothetical protein GCM10010399_43980 [Dactylosporangium fulvum]|uniref:Uncharacterized protein n=1 Tax=Dactylosporangium fulvum TaxID=53359 RepID=A0ABY5W999_9ACTN|nr:hypothetical protein [Dactylosporangium fulvum]UWP85935.1 hypothetical protein Dfulv_17450 [Dactylosporangium fulvum]